MSSALPARLEAHVCHLAELGEKSTRRQAALAAAADYVGQQLAGAGLEVGRQTFPASGVECVNLAAAVPGFSTAAPHYLIGAHYDSAPGTPGADDNCSAVALLLELAAHYAGQPLAGRLRFAAFTNEEPPHFLGPTMGSLVFARRCREEKVGLRGMVCLESLGVFTDEPGSQGFPPGMEHFVPAGSPFARGNFAALVDDGRDPEFARTFGAGFAFAQTLPALPLTLPDLGVSDHWSFWECEYPAIMVTDTAMYRNRHYHLPTDTAEKLNYPGMAGVFVALRAGIDALLAAKG